MFFILGTMMPAQKVNIKFPTFGGYQFWSDCYYRDGWRIQKNSITGHCRLLSPGRIRHAWGTKEQCLKKLDSMGIKFDEGKITILIHGLARTRHSLKNLKKRLTEEHGLNVITISYASMIRDIDSHSSNLKSLLEGLKKADSINFITHSMGGIVVRDFLKNNKDDRIHRLVMLAPPNKGSDLAGTLLIKPFVGPAGRQLIKSKNYINELPAPSCPFMVIGGIKGTKMGYLLMSFMWKSDNDGVVKIENTKLDEAVSNEEVVSSHTFIMNKDETFKLISGFLIDG